MTKIVTAKLILSVVVVFLLCTTYVLSKEKRKFYTIGRDGDGCVEISKMWMEMIDENFIKTVVDKDVFGKPVAYIYISKDKKSTLPAFTTKEGCAQHVKGLMQIEHNNAVVWTEEMVNEIIGHMFEHDDRLTVYKNKSDLAEISKFRKEIWSFINSHSTQVEYKNALDAIFNNFAEMAKPKLEEYYKSKEFDQENPPDWYCGNRTFAKIRVLGYTYEMKFGEQYKEY